MCELKQKLENENCSSGEKVKLNVATIEGGRDDGVVDNYISPEDLTKNAEYYETALETTGFGKFNYFIILVSGLILTNVLLETLGMSFVLPVCQCDLNLSIQERGILSAIGFAGIISSSHLWGFLADTRGRRNIIRPTLLVGFLVSVISSFSTKFWLLVILRYINGFCISGGSATIYAYLGEFHTSKNRSRAIMGAAFIFGVGAMMLPLIAWLVINQEWRLDIPFIDITYKPWRFFIVVCGIPGFMCGLCLFKIPESPKFLLSKGQKEKSLEILKAIFQMNTGNSKDDYPITTVLEDLDSAMNPKLNRARQNTNAVTALIRSMWNQTQPLFNRQYMRSTILICLIQFWIFVTSNGMYMWFPHILNSIAEYRLDNPNLRISICQIVYDQQDNDIITHKINSTASELQSPNVEECNEKLDISTYQHSLTLELLYAVGFAIIGAFINKIGKMRILFFCLAFCGVCGIGAVFIDVPTIAIYLYIGLLLCGLGINVLSAATVDLYPTRLRAMAVCISLMMGRLGSVVGANIVGALLTNYCETVFIASGVSLIVSAFLGFLIPKPVEFLGRQDSPRRTSLISMTGN